MLIYVKKKCFSSDGQTDVQLKTIARKLTKVYENLKKKTIVLSEIGNRVIVIVFSITITLIVCNCNCLSFLLLPLTFSLFFKSLDLKYIYNNLQQCRKHTF